MYILIISLLISIIIVLAILHRKNIAEHIKNKICQLNKEIQKKEEAYAEIERRLEEQSRAIGERIKEQESRLDEIYELLKKEIDKKAEEYKENQISKIKMELNYKKQEEEIKLCSELDKAQKEAKLKKELIDFEMTQISNELQEYQQKRDAINKDIRRQRELEEQQDFFRVCIEQDSVEDISLLRGIRPNLHYRENLDKMIYNSYISKPVLSMTKRILNGKTISGIYKITRIKTGEIYIGKSTDIKSRWQQHAKTALNCGTIAHSILHTTMEKDGLENFTFELIEEVKKDQLSEREKYWINFYDSKSYGLNEKAG